MRSLELYADYDRKGIHHIFDPDSPFTAQAGTWGLHGIIALPNRIGDYVLIVTYGKEQGEHRFDEGISTEGILRWQSQPSQALNDRRVQHLIQHDEDRNAIHLFLRTRERHNGVLASYTYLGRLKYHSHDRERQRPVHIAWQLQQWPIPGDVLNRMDLRLEGQIPFLPAIGAEPIVPLHDILREDAPPSGGSDGEPTRTFRAVKRRYLSDHESRTLGLQGEHLVLERERKKLSALGRPDLAASVRHVSDIEGDGAGYDIHSFFPDGRPKFIEVKTTRGPKNADFWISPNEIAFSANHAESYELCRVFDYEPVTNSGACYSVWGDISHFFMLTPSEYRAKPAPTPANRCTHEA